MFYNLTIFLNIFKTIMVFPQCGSCGESLERVQGLLGEDGKG